MSKESLSPSDRIDKIVGEFAAIDGWEQRYAHIIQMGKNLESLDESEKSDDNRIKGCQSQVWLVASPSANQTISFRGDSDAILVRGLVALLLNVYSGSTASEILNTPIDFIKEIGLDSHLSVSRSNGLQAMLKKIHYYAIAFEHIYKNSSNN